MPTNTCLVFKLPLKFLHRIHKYPAKVLQNKNDPAPQYEKVNLTSIIGPRFSKPLQMYVHQKPQSEN